MSSNLKLSRRKRFLFRLASLAVGLTIGLISAEIVLRIAGYSAPSFFQPDEKLGYGLVPGLSGYQRREGSSYIQINADGFNDLEHQLQKPSDTLRIAFVGDSFVEARQILHSQSFPHHVRLVLEQCETYGGRRIETLSFGVAGYGTAQELIMVREKVLKYSPDIVVLILYTNNDITDNSRFFRDLPVPYFVEKDGELIADNSFLETTKFKFSNSSVSWLGKRLYNSLRVVQAIGEAQRSLSITYRDWRGRRSSADASAVDNGAVPGPLPAFEVGTENEIYKVPQSEMLIDAWHVTERILLEMKKTVEKAGAKFAVVTASNAVQVLPRVEERKRYARLLGIEDLYYPDRRIAGFCESNGIPIYTLSPFLAAYAEKEQVNLHGFGGNMGYGHWNEVGHQVAGVEIGEQLCEGSLRW